MDANISAQILGAFFFKIGWFPHARVIELLRNYCATIASLPATPFTPTLSGPLRLRVQSRVEDAVENRGLYICFALVLKGFGTL